MSFYKSSITKCGKNVGRGNVLSICYNPSPTTTTSTTEWKPLDTILEYACKDQTILIHQVEFWNFPWHEPQVIELVETALRQQQNQNQQQQWRFVTIGSETAPPPVSSRWPEQRKQVLVPTMDWNVTKCLSLRHVNEIGPNFTLGRCMSKLMFHFGSLNATSSAHLGQALLRKGQQSTSVFAFNDDDDDNRKDDNTKSQHAPLTHLEMTRTYFVDHAAFAEMSKGIAHHPTLQSIDLWGCKLQDEDMASFLCQPPPNLQELELSGNSCGPQTTQALAQLLSQEPSSSKNLKTGLCILGLDSCWQEVSTSNNNNNNNKDCKYNFLQTLCHALKTNQSLRLLSLQHNELDDSDMNTIITGTLIHNKTLETLYLGGNMDVNSMTDATLQCLASKLHRIQLRGLYMCSVGNQFGPSGLTSLADAMTKNHTLEHLYIVDGCNKLSKDDCQSPLEKMEYYCNLNLGGIRRLVHYMICDSNDHQFPMALCPLVLEKINRLEEEDNRQRQAKKSHNFPNQGTPAAADKFFHLLRSGALMKHFP